MFQNSHIMLRRSLDVQTFCTSLANINGFSQKLGAKKTDPLVEPRKEAPFLSDDPGSQAILPQNIEKKL
jgi:hypothetical protein